MFFGCYCVCIRPGIGTVSDSLLSQNYIFTFHKNSPEMNYNSSIISLIGFGEKANNPFDAYIKAIGLFSRKEKLDIILQKTLLLNPNGVSESSKIIEKLIFGTNPF